MSAVSPMEESDSTRSLAAADVSMICRREHGPRLLVSVRSVGEAKQALSGRAEILDVKEPSLGSLGMAEIDEIERIAGLSEITSGQIPLSVALGEVKDWLTTSVYPPLPKAVTFAKLGLSQIGHDAKWRGTWQGVRAQFERRCSSRISWVAVAYADAKEARSPTITEVLAAAIETNCAGLLVDTWTKGGLTLLDRIDAIQLTEIASICHDHGLFFAIAGKLSLHSLAALTDVPADVIAIRSAACRGTDRTLELDPIRIKNFRKEMRRSFVR